MQTELKFLQELYPTLVEVRQTDKYSEQMLCVSEATNKVLDRIIELRNAAVLTSEGLHQGPWGECKECMRTNYAEYEHDRLKRKEETDASEL